MRATCVELPPFARFRAEYLDDEGFAALQHRLMANPEAGDLIPGSGGLRKLRFGDKRRGRGTRGGLRIIYYWWVAGSEFWLATLYDKNEASDLAAQERRALKKMLDAEMDARK